MAADLHIHVITEEFTEEHVKAFESHTLDSKYFDEDYDSRARFEKKHKCDLFKAVGETPNVWVGEVSWLKAALLKDPDKFIPDPISGVSEAIGEDFPVIDDELIFKIKKALESENSTGYSIAESDKVIRFLEENRGKKVFTISW